jgi:hypothetical protein
VAVQLLYRRPCEYVCPWKCAAALIGALVLAGPAGAAQGGQKLDHALRNGNSGKNERVIIRSKPGRRAELKQALKACGHKIKGEHALVDAVTVELGSDCIQKLIALRKLGAVQEGKLHNAFLRHGVYHDQNIWSILASAWAEANVTWEPRAA